MKIKKFVEKCSTRNETLDYDTILGINKYKEFIPSIANTHGTDLSKYYILEKNNFACNLMHIGRDEVIPISYYTNDDPAIISPAYKVFKISDESIVLPKYLFLLFKSEWLDRLCWFKTDDSVRGSLSWTDFTNIDLPIPSLEIQKNIINTYELFLRNINTLKNINKQLYYLSQKIYEKWFIDFEYPLPNGKTYKSSGGKFKKEQDKLIPIDMEISTIGEICDCQNGYAFYKKGYDQSGIMVIDLGNVDLQGNFTYTNSDKFVSKEKIPNDKFIVKKNDLVMIMTDRKATMDLLGKTGKIFEEKNYALNQRVYRIRPKINVNYVYSFLNNYSTLGILKKNALGSVQRYVNTDHINDLKILIPDDKLMDDYSKIVNPLFLSMEENTLQIRKLEDIKDITMSKLLSEESDSKLILEKINKILC